MNKRDLLTLNLSGTYCQKSGTRLPSSVIPRQPAIYLWYKSKIVNFTWWKSLINVFKTSLSLHLCWSTKVLCTTFHKQMLTRHNKQWYHCMEWQIIAHSHFLFDLLCSLFFVLFNKENGFFGLKFNLPLKDIFCCANYFIRS